MKARIARFGVLTSICFGMAQGGTLGRSAPAAPEATAAIAEARYCFARLRGLDPGHLPPAYLVLQLRIRVSYRNPGGRPLIVPLQRDRTVYTALRPGTMSVLHEGFSLFDPASKPLKDVPADFDPSKKNDLFAVIPAGGEMTPPLEDVTLPVDRRAGFKKSPDLRGHTVYLRLRFAQQDISAPLKATLSDRWAPFGIPWSGTLLTNTMMIEIPKNPVQVAPCGEFLTKDPSEQAPVGR